jgi:glycosyltransferase involved in cell wall biosynthesis
LDVDDAIWVYRGGSFARRLARFSDLVICGNSFLAETFSQWNSQIRILPTAVDTNFYRPQDLNLKQDKPIVGWSGSSSGFKYLYQIEPVLAKILKKYPDAELWIVSDQAPKFHYLPLDQYKFVQWTPENELMTIQRMTVGIMPLSDSVWERGKCSFKMLTYMACGIPVVVSRVGMNVEILSLGKIGCGTIVEADWEIAIDYLLTHPIEAHRMGCVGREIVLRHFSIDVVAPKLGEYLRMVAG